MKFVLLICLLCGAFVTSSSTLDELKEFTKWALTFNKSYESLDDRKNSVKNFVLNKRRIELHNEDFTRGDVSYTQTLNQFSDRLITDLISSLGLIVPVDIQGEIPNFNLFPTSYESLDWRDANLVGPVEDQGGCGSCWTYSSKGVVEGILRRKNIFTPVSSQQLVDCSKDGCWGCSGGWPHYALNFLKSNGAASQADYPYKATDEACSYDQSKKLNLKLNETKLFYLNGDENMLKNIVTKIGPISILMSVGQTFFDYSSGVYTDPQCGKDVNHAMTLVGYGTDSKYGKYWLIKNSWGTSWGEKGYARVARDKDNQCNIAHSAVYATEAQNP